MNLRKFIVEVGTGVDQHGQDPTNAARKAVKDAVSRACLAGLIEIARLSDVNEMIVEILIACPYADRVDTEEVLHALPFGRSASCRVVEGGMIAHTVVQPELGDTSDEMIVANAAVTVSVDMDRVLESWKEDRRNC